MANLFIAPQTQFFGTDNLPLVGGKVYTYLTGTSTPSQTFNNTDGSTANANPVILDSNGRAPIYLDGDIVYRIVVKTSADVTVSTTDNVRGIGTVITNDITLAADLDTTNGNIITESNRDINFEQDSTDRYSLTNVKLTSDASSTTYNITINTAKGPVSEGGTAIAKFTGAASSVNYIGVGGSQPTIAALGSDTNIDLKLLPKGTGTINVSSVANYEDNITDDDDLVTKKYIEDNCANAAMTISTGLLFYVSSGTPVNIRSDNVSSITDNGTGDFTVNFTSNYTTDDYCAFITIGDNSTGFGEIAATATSSVTVKLYTCNAGTKSASDLGSDRHCLLIFGVR